MSLLFREQSSNPQNCGAHHSEEREILREGCREHEGTLAGTGKAVHFAYASNRLRNLSQGLPRRGATVNLVCLERELPSPL